MKLLKSEGIGLSLIVLLNLFLRLFRLDSPNFAYFDEKNFFLPVIRNSLQGLPDFSNEQPQLVKYIIVQSIRLFGDNPWGWRIPSAIFGILLVLATYFLAKKIFGGKSIPLLSALFLTFEFSLFIHSRIIMMEVFFATFVIFGFLFIWSYVKNLKLQDILLAGAFFGLAAQVKWATAIPLALALIFIFFTQANLIRKVFAILGVLIITILIYILLYLPFITANGLSQWINLHQKVWYYHTSLLPQNFEKYAPDYIPRFQEVEIYTRSRLSWLIDPQGFYFEDMTSSAQKTSVILFFFNPIVFFGGLLAMLYTLFKNIEDKRVLFTSSIFLSAYLPLFLTPGPAFPHYLLFGLPALSILLSYFLTQSIKTSMWLIIVILILTIMVFALYYPLISALPIPEWYFHLLTRF
ncbi:MAG: glycosyl transferase family 39 [Candidatus Curtissbacteria bacterium GW2011_GWA2_41_24]|uniref:Glycosyl transferase family 39 n=1 Tax=Candidatus Curtissbacteria bacterium GW2011_GWA2_41_24 TaxID=1618411 RepID=A0A0G0VUI1_9BACT|nr:MAG: glycosyl transferase family 39 [Candidatus Curtissbacteria bacterium GW2011_GWA2_41_24]